MSFAVCLRKCYLWRLFEYKGGSLTLLWLFSCSVLMSYMFVCNCFIGTNRYLNSGLFFVSMIVVIPVAGWLADVHYGRYRVLKVSVLILWSTGILSLLTMSAEKMLPHCRVFEVLQILIFVVMLIGMGGFLATIIQFGIDQFVDASSMKLSSYINWCVWVFYLGVATQLGSRACVCGNYQLISKYLVPFFLTVTVCSDFFCSRCLIKEPTGLNPYRLMYKVLQYAVRNKYPQQRSAFTYWDDKRYSRIDLAKSKFGGPFSTEQVEDVKTFFRMITFMLVVSFSAVVCFEVRFLNTVLFSHHVIFEEGCYTGQCYKHVLANYLNYLLMVAIVPLFEFIVRPILSYKLPRLTRAITITRKFVLGLFFLLLYNATLFLVQILDSRNEPGEKICFLFDNSTILLQPDNMLSFSLWWLVIPKVFSGMAFFILTTAFLEFVCAQCPYSMKGFLLGVAYGLISLAIVFSYLIGYLLQWIFRRAKLEAYNCGIWYFAILVAVNILLMCLTGAMVWWYPLRRRDENVHNEHMFAVNYYDRYIEIDAEHEVSGCEYD